MLSGRCSNTRARTPSKVIQINAKNSRVARGRGLRDSRARAEKAPKAEDKAKADSSKSKKAKKPGPQPPPKAGLRFARRSNGASKPAEDNDMAEQILAEDAQQQATAELLLAAIQDGNLDEAEDLANAVLKEQDGLASAVEAAEDKAKQSQKTLDQLKDQYRRLQADFDNFRSRADAEKTQSGANVKKGVVQDLLPLIDNFELAASQIKPQTTAEEKINESYQGLYRQMVDIFRNMGLEAVPTVGTPFDPELHDGIMKEEVEDQADGFVLEEFRKGFMLSGKLVRAAMVKVAVNNSAPPAAASQSEGEDVAGQKGADASGSE